MRRLLVPELPKEELPELADPRWRYWSKELALLIRHNPTDWDSLKAYATMRDVSDMMLRNLLAYLEFQHYAVGYVNGTSTVKWCGCSNPCKLPRKGCPKAKSLPTPSPNLYKDSAPPRIVYSR